MQVAERIRYVDTKVRAAEPPPPPGRTALPCRGQTPPATREDHGDALDRRHRRPGSLAPERGEEEAEVLEHLVGHVVAQREAELDMQHAQLGADAQAQRLVEASLELRDLGVDPAEYLDRPVLGDKDARQIVRKPSGDVAQRDVGVSHAARSRQIACHGPERRNQRRLGREERASGLAPPWRTAASPAPAAAGRARAARR
ncbi:hypothetical protein [Sorangium sp. So ce448]|uniref:hypothetical protein n=1 Tax=Sorangium sp. So ce448 TaxID=3133314 RepID=UPI003F62B201